VVNLFLSALQLSFESYLQKYIGFATNSKGTAVPWSFAPDAAAVALLVSSIVETFNPPMADNRDELRNRNR